MLRIALPNKGRLAEDTRQLFADAGLPVRASSERSLSAALGRDGEFEAIFVRAQDVAEFVADGAADAGVTGWDLVCEAERPVQQLLDLGFGSCRVVLASREGFEIGVGTRVATVFPRITRAYFERQELAVEIVPVSGAAEIAPHLGIANVIVDITSTGSTLKTNGLVELATVMCSSARLIARRGAVARELDELVAALGSVIRARGQRYLMANVPRSELGRVKQVLPGLNGPTVVDVIDGGRFVAVHAVVAAEGIYRTIANLKALGAEGVLVTRIERLMA
jgi:ATP phosphoribosyltransferase